MLIANDEDIQLMIQELLFEGKMFDVTKATNGFEAYQLVKNSIVGHDEAQLFDLIVLDLNMPIENGYNAARMITRLY